MTEIEAIVWAIRRIPGRSDLFNHYSRFESEREGAEAPELRCRNLELYLSSFAGKPLSEMWVADAPSRYGARWSGVPFTHQNKLSDMARLLGLNEQFVVPTKSPETRPSGTSAAIWRMLSPPMPLLWNAVMLHPYKVVGGQVRNAETSREHQELNRGALKMVVNQFRPQRVIAIGSEAFKALTRAGIGSTQVSHPGRNRHALFWTDMEKLGRRLV